MSTICLYCGNPMQSQRSTKKYCSDNCKQLAFYKRSGLALVSNDENLALTGNQNDDEEPMDTEVSLVEFRKHELNEDLAPQSLDDKHPSRANISFATKSSQEEVPYEWVHSKIIYSIADYVDNSEALSMFQHPGQYWGVYALPTVKWVSIRLRCLVESVIKLSNFSAVLYDNIIALKEAFTGLISSSHFKLLPVNYPFTTLIKEIEQKLALIASQHDRGESIRFWLSASRKVQLIAVRFVLADFVPSVKFSEICFHD